MNSRCAISCVVECENEYKAEVLFECINDAAAMAKQFGVSAVYIGQSGFIHEFNIEREMNVVRICGEVKKCFSAADMMQLINWLEDYAQICRVSVTYDNEADRRFGHYEYDSSAILRHRNLPSEHYSASAGAHARKRALMMKLNMHGIDEKIAFA